MKSKKNILLVFLNIALSVFLVIGVVNIGHTISYAKSINTDNTVVQFKNNDASSEKKVSDKNIIRDFNGNDFILSLSEDKNYVFIGTNMNYQFSGKYEYKNGKDALDFVSNDVLKNAGLNKNKINIDNLYVIKAFYGQHLFKDGTEFYNNKIQNPENDAFYFLVYFKESKEGEFVSGIHYIGDTSEINFATSYF